MAGKFSSALQKISPVVLGSSLLLLPFFMNGIGNRGEEPVNRGEQPVYSSNEGSSWLYTLLRYLGLGNNRGVYDQDDIGNTRAYDRDDLNRGGSYDGDDNGGGLFGLGNGIHIHYSGNATVSLGDYNL